MDRTKTIAVNLCVIAVIAVILIWGNTLYRQHTQFEKGEKALAANDYLHAIAGFESAIHMYTPFSSLVEKGAQRLWQVGERMEQERNLDMALIAYRALRSSFYAVRGLTAPGKAWIARCDGKISQLLEQQARRIAPPAR